MAQKIGKYEVIEQIGRGGMGTIFRARDPILERSVALKVISDLEVTPELRSRFFREAQACARITHPNIVIVHDMGEDDGRLFIVMELLEGEELRRVIARHEQLSLPEKLDIVRQLCDGLHFAHQKGVVHRDVKPANILLLRTGRVKILDFGIAQLVGAATQRDLTRTGMIMGTIRYMAPEQVRGQADRRSDIFSVSAVSYELFSGRPPFSGDDPLQILEQLRTTTPPRLTELDPNLPSELADVIARGIQREPGERFADLGQMGKSSSVSSASLRGRLSAWTPVIAEGSRRGRCPLPSRPCRPSR
jgi:serine/threonine protein kinase